MNRTLPFALLALVSAAGCELPSAPAPAGGPTGGLSEGSEHTAPSTAPAVCAPVFALECGQNAVGDTADWNAGATNVMANYPMGVGTFDGPEITYSFTAPADGAVTFRLVNPAPMEIDHDVFVLEEVCAPDHNVANGYNATTFEARRGQTYFLVVDGYNGAAGGFEVAVECANPAPPVEPPTGTPPGDPPAEPPCAAFHSDESESAPIQTTGASLPASVTSRSWTTPTSWTSWVDFAGVPGHGATHEGIDWIHADPDVAVVDVRAASAGTVVYVRTGCPESSRFGHNDSARECGSGWGNHVVVAHGSGLYTRYAHLAEDDIDVEVGQGLQEGERLAGMGNSGRSEERHLHFELGASDTPFDPCAPARSFDEVFPPVTLF